MNTNDLTKQAVETWLIGYAWMGTEDEQRRNVECIMAQDAWKYLDARIDQIKGQASGEETNLDLEAHEYALSALYECHDGPHQATCPDYKSEN